MTACKTNWRSAFCSWFWRTSLPYPI